MKKRVLAGLLAAAMFISSFGSSELTVQAEQTSSEEVVSEEMGMENTEEIISTEKSEETTEIIVYEVKSDTEMVIPNDETGIPDTNLYNAILEYADCNDDGVLTTKEAASVSRIFVMQSQISTLQGIEYCKNLEILRFFGYREKIEDMSALSELTNLTWLELPTAQVNDISILSNLVNLETLRLYNNEISDIGVLANLENLKELDLSSNKISDISVLADLTNLTSLTLNSNEIEDIGILSNLTNLTSLNLSSCKIDDIRMLSNLTDITSLYLSSNEINNISALSNLKNLTHLNLDSNKISDISTLSNLEHLNFLWLSNNEISDVKSLENLVELIRLDLSYNEIRDAGTLENLPNLDYLNLEGNPIGESDEIIITNDANGIPDTNLYNAILEAADSNGDRILTVTEAVNITSLHVYSSNISDLRGIESCENLINLSLRNNEIRDISALSTLTKLVSLNLMENKISDISVLSTLSSLELLYLDFNEIRDVSALSTLTNLRELGLSNNRIVDIRPLDGLQNLEQLDLKLNPLNRYIEEYELDIQLNEKRLTNKQATISVKATGCTDREIVLSLTLCDETETQVQNKTVSLKREKDYTGEITFENLLAGTKYSIIDAEFSFIDDEYGQGYLKVYIGSKPCEYSFVTIDKEKDIIISSDGTGIPDTNLYSAILKSADSNDDGVLTVLEAANIKSLNAHGSCISNLQGIQYCANLEELILTSNQIKDINELSALTSLKEIYLAYNEICEISDMSKLINLTYLSIGNNKINDISGLQYATNLETLLLNSNKISDISALSNLSNLRELQLWENEISDISAISNLSELHDINLSNNEISDISAISNLSKLQNIWLSNNKIDDISILSGLTRLRRLYLSSNEIVDVSSLANFVNLEVIDLSYNKIVDTSPLNGLSNLIRIDLRYNPLDSYMEDYEFEFQIDENRLTSEQAIISVNATKCTDRKIAVSFVLSDEDKNNVQTKIINLDSEKNYTGEIIFDNLLAGLKYTITSVEISFTNDNMTVIVSEPCEFSFVTKEEEKIILNKKNGIPDTNLYNAILEAADSNEDGVLTTVEAAAITDLNISNLIIDDLQGIQYCTDLEYLSLWWCGISDINELSSLQNLKSLYLSDYISDISVLADLTNLEELYLVSTNISDISVLADIPNLKYLRLSSNNRIKDFSIISDLTNLENLGLSSMDIDDLSIVSNLTNLKGLELSFMDINDLSIITNLKNLSSLSLYGNEIEDIGILSDFMELRYLYLENNHIKDISALSNLMNLYSLNLGYNEIEDIRALSNLTELDTLYLEKNKISDITPLKNLKNLYDLDLSYNRIVDASPLEQLEYLEELDLSYNPLGRYVEEYALTFELDENNVTDESAVITVTAKGCTDSKIRLSLILSDENGYEVQNTTIDLDSENGYTNKVTWKGLLGSAKYTISNAEFNFLDNNTWVYIGSKECDYSFTTKAPTLPNSISISEEAIGLNLFTDNDSLVGEGFDYQTLTVKVEPKDAAADVIWSSSNSDIASVDENGTVYANAYGDAIITATSRYDENISASCKVSVRNYAVLYANAGGEPQQLSDIAIAKGESIEGIAYYELKEDGTKVLLEDYTVTLAKTDIVNWDGEKLEAVSVGKTTVIFEKDGVKAMLDVNVSLKPVGFGITGLSVVGSSYSEIMNSDGSYTVPLVTGVTYSIIGETSPVNVFEAIDFTWKSSDETIATVDESGIVNPIKTGVVTITVTPKNTGTGTLYVQTEAKLTLYIKELPTVGVTESLYALTHSATKLKQIAISEILGEGWNWKYPDTALVVSGNNTAAYQFQAVYTGEKYYPTETTIPVYIGTITGLTVSEVEGNHKQVLETGTDSIKLTVDLLKQGIVNDGMYEIEIPDVKGLSIIENEDGTYTITAEKAGTYTLKPVVKVNGKTLKFKKAVTYKITAVDKAQAASIELFTDTDGVKIENNKIVFETVAAKKNFTLNAIVKDSKDSEITTKLQWKTSDASVIKVAANKKDSHKVMVTAVGEGHAVITVIAQDSLKYQVTLDVEIQNHTPRVSTNKATVNIAYDYNTTAGKSLASTAGLVEIIPVYGETITDDMQLLDKEGKVVTDLRMERYGNNYLVVPTKGEIPTGKYVCTLRVTTSKDISYDYPLTITVSNKLPTVKVKSNNAINLFYRDRFSDVYFTLPSNTLITNVAWEDKSDATGNGFAISADSWYGDSVRVTQEDIEVVKGKLQDKNVAKGTLSLTLEGYRIPYVIKNFSVKYNYKKPNIVSNNASTTVAPALGQNSEYFSLYDKSTGHYVRYYENGSSYFSETCYDKLIFNDENVDLTYDTYGMNYTYKGAKNSYKFTFTLDSVFWRESVNVSHTIKVKNPVPVLYNNEIIFNLKEHSKAVANLYVDTNVNVELADIIVTGKNTKAKNLLEKDLLVITADAKNREIRIEQNDAALMKEKLQAGTYEYKVTPYCKNVTTGENVALKTLILKVKIVDKPVTVKVSTKGSIDLSNGTNYSTYDKIVNAVVLTEKFSNLATGDQYSSERLVGAYSEYFTLNYGHITVNPEYLGSLKAGQTYKLAVEYTIQNSSGETYMVTSNTFSIKPKQTAPKVTVSNNNQIFYVAADNAVRYYNIAVPQYYYTIEDVSGAYDCNKDGIADIMVSKHSNDGTNCTLKVEIVNKNAVTASAKGKAYSIPVTVKLEGCDGISKDASVNIKITVKR